MSHMNVCRLLLEWSGQGFVQGRKTVIQSHALWLLDGKGETPISAWGKKMQDKGEFTRVVQNGAVLSVKKELRR